MEHQASCHYMNLDRTFTVEDLAAFHSHLGPYIVLGYRIGRFAREQICKDPFSLKARVFCTTIPPQSCLADGVQLGSGCTLGKRNIELIRSDDVYCEFESDGKTVRVVPAPFFLPPRVENDDYERQIEEYAEKMYYLPDSDLFSVERLA
ncbi:formylmethanofuran dehydrogenase subunit E family protein [Methanofollis tationis]|uniref:Formylmethanofuran dehydrogenase subunit E n=1 Tax=Methanofollis tationis TaxID=81417 RepID=A0A7K4HQ25_9EURY|nr:formylmethanofuran dehydrogenase subunit E family protein [Methanofollis tationis]NVO67010.1 formylmethanofuran dehydrogenase subunit E [Methanofollis tationis]